MNPHCSCLKVFLLACGLLCGGADYWLSGADAVPATRPSDDTASAIRRLLANPRDEKQWEAFKDPRIQNEAWPVLEAAIRNAKPTKQVGFFIRPDADPSNLLEAMPAINGPRATGLVLELARAAPDPSLRRQALYIIGDPLKLTSPRAIFSLADPGATPDSRGLPMTAALTLPGRPPEKVLIVQAERVPMGNCTTA